jgi:hypothetical protein
MAGRHPEFSEAMKVGKSVADDRMERSLYQRGIGYDIDLKKTDEDRRKKCQKP